jgi:hypothetical protein
MNRAAHRKELELGLNTVFGMQYKQYPMEYREIYEVLRSRKAKEEDVMTQGFAGARVKGEGQGVTYASGGEVYTARYQHVTIALAFALTEEAQEDNLYGDLGARYSKALARAMAQTKEVYGANVLNNGFDSNFPIGDGVALFSTSHPTNGGVTSNTLPQAAQLSEVSLEQVGVNVSMMTDHRGIPAALTIKKLVIPPQLEPTATRILKSTKRTGTADNDINYINYSGLVQGMAVNRRLTNPANWFCLTDCPDGFKHFVRVGIQRGVEGDFETGNIRYKARERYSFGVSDWRAGVGVQGY